MLGRRIEQVRITISFRLLHPQALAFFAVSIGEKLRLKSESHKANPDDFSTDEDLAVDKSTECRQ